MQSNIEHDYDFQRFYYMPNTKPDIADDVLIMSVYHTKIVCNKDKNLASTVSTASCNQFLGVEQRAKVVRILIQSIRLVEDSSRRRQCSVDVVSTLFYKRCFNVDQSTLVSTWFLNFE